MSILVDIIPAKFRRYVYATYAFIGLILGALAVAGVDVYTATAVYAFIGSALGLTAYSNTSAKGDNNVTE